MAGNADTAAALASVTRRGPGGYADPGYAASLEEFGSPRPLSRCGGWLLERPIAGFSHRDAMGCYPLFACRDWSRLPEDLDGLGEDLVSVVLVADPFGAGPEFLRRCFDLVMPFKEHCVVELTRSSPGNPSSHHRRYSRRALREHIVERVAHPTEFAAEWTTLYGSLIERHGIRGIPAFSPRGLARQLAVPGLVVWRAEREGKTVGATLWLQHGDVAYYHLGAYAEAGYRSRASFALFSTAIEGFAAMGVRWLDLGGGAGTRATAADDGLTRFKRGWATSSRTVYLCGRVLAPEIYRRLTESLPQTGYFPAYRQGEFA
jgi:Acetyltransferase (GNAT) domain